MTCTSSILKKEKQKIHIAYENWAKIIAFRTAYEIVKKRIHFYAKNIFLFEMKSKQNINKFRNV